MSILLYFSISLSTSTSKLRKFAALFLRLLSSIGVASRPGANIKFYNRAIRFRKPEALRSPFDRETRRRGRQRGKESEEAKKRVFCVKRCACRCCHRVYRVDWAPQGGRAFYYLRRGPLKAMPGNKQRGPKERGPKERGPDRRK